MIIVINEAFNIVEKLMGLCNRQELKYKRNMLNHILSTTRQTNVCAYDKLTVIFSLLQNPTECSAEETTLFVRNTFFCMFFY